MEVTYSYRIKIKELEQTSHGCTDIWEGVLKDGRRLYILRKGNLLSISIGKTLRDAVYSDNDSDFECLIEDRSFSLTEMQTKRMMAVCDEFLQIEWPENLSILEENG